MLTVPESKIIHGVYRNAFEELIRRAAKPDWDWKYYYFIRNRIYTCRKHGNAGLTLYKTLMKMSLQTAREILNRHQFRFHNMNILLWATLDGFISKLGENNKFLPK
jgi:hypothetical protein